MIGYTTPADVGLSTEEDEEEPRVPYVNPEVRPVVSSDDEGPESEGGDGDGPAAFENLEYMPEQADDWGRDGPMMEREEGGLHPLPREWGEYSMNYTAIAI
jgi:hypothetical protein